MADPIVRRARGVFIGTVGSTAMVAGDAVYFDGTDWELADADDNTKFAEAFSTQSFASGVVGTFCTECIIEDTDAPYTQGNTLYLSATAGDITATRPTGANNLMQVLGFSISASEVHARVKIPEEITINVHLVGDGTAVFAQNGDWTGVLLAAAAEAAGGSFMVPQNVVGNVIQYLWWTNGASAPALDTSDTYTIDVSAGVDDETTTATTDGITASSLAVADNDLNRAAVTTAFDASGIIEPGNVVCIDVDKAAEGAGGDDPLMLCCSIVLLAV